MASFLFKKLISCFINRTTEHPIGIMSASQSSYLQSVLNLYSECDNILSDKALFDSLRSCTEIEIDNFIKLFNFIESGYRIRIYYRTVISDRRSDQRVVLEDQTEQGGEMIWVPIKTLFGIIWKKILYNLDISDLLSRINNQISQSNMGEDMCKRLVCLLYRLDPNVAYYDERLVSIQIGRCVTRIRKDSIPTDEEIMIERVFDKILVSELKLLKVGYFLVIRTDGSLEYVSDSDLSEEMDADWILLDCPSTDSVYFLAELICTYPDLRMALLRSEDVVQFLLSHRDLFFKQCTPPVHSTKRFFRYNYYESNTSLLV